LPDGETRERVVNFRLNEKTLCVRNIHQRCKTRLIPRTFLRFSCARGVEFKRSVFSHFARAVERGLRLAKLSREILQRLVVARLFRAFVRGFDRFLRFD
jgi:hypothetical protein